MKDKYFLLNGRSYPDTGTPGPLEVADGVNHSAAAGDHQHHAVEGALRISDLDVSEYQTLASLAFR
jgi:hypothetical protein